MNNDRPHRARSRSRQPPMRVLVISCQAMQQLTPDSPLTPCPGLAVGLYRSECSCDAAHVRKRWLCAGCRDGQSQRGTLCLQCLQQGNPDCAMGPVTEVAA